jgi:hypothetical protein
VDICVKTEYREKVERGYGSIPYFAREILEQDLHVEQEAALAGMRCREESAIVTGNRWGKGDLIKIFGSWIAMYKPVDKKFREKSVSILNTSISQDQANIVFDKFQDTLLDKKGFSWAIKDIKKSPFPHIVFKSGITWWFRNASQNGKFLEGRSYFWSNFDEADLQDDFQTFLEDILLPRLWDYGGPLTWTTTPRRGKRNAYKRWDALRGRIKAGSPLGYAFQGDSRRNKFLHASAIEKMNRLPPRLLNKNVLGMFEDSSGVITADALEYCQLVADGVQEKPIPGRRYINAWDFARSSTFNVGLTIEVGEPLQLRSWERKQDPGNRNRLYWQGITESVKARHKVWRGATAVDATGLGDVLGSYLEAINPVLFKLNPGLRAQIIEEGVTTIEAGEIGLPLREITQVKGGEYWSLEDELTDFDPEALDVLVWDFVCALFIGIWLARGNRPRTAGGSKKAKPRVYPVARGVAKHVAV